ncbi:unnamed protein product [Heligmosomoides polygyrus]|uniref:Fibrous sheath-interacting protein 1 n=1 Tax=Heligmosomoides polygyrus TaxID=6339 RepID=A0A183F3G0_HELPZ|nr:unnamed protein product [Heligmosomoides polygyrus]
MCVVRRCARCAWETRERVALCISDAERPQRYIEHAPSVAELVDDADSFDSFEFEEHKANSLFPSENGSLRCSSVTYNSEFDLSKVVNYNEDMEETNAFHKYFDTAEATARVTERKQRERAFASFLTRLAESAYVEVVLPKPASFGSAFYLKPECAFHGAQAAVLGTVSKDIEAAEQSEFERSECVLKKQLSEPREPDLPMKLSYKGQEIAVSVSEVEKDEVTMNEDGEYEIFKKTCLETSLEFDTEVDITQSIRKIYNALPDQTGDFCITPDSGSRMLATYKEIFDPSLTDYVLGADPIVREIVTYSKEGAPVPSTRFDSLPLHSSERTTSGGAAELESSLFDPDFLSKMREIERIARQVDEELGQLSSPVPVSSQPDDVKEIENAIFKISDQLVLAHPITEAQAEANEELLRTTLADMILNPARTAQEELELMKRPIRLIKRKLSDIENSLMEDAEVTDITEHACSATDADASTETTDMAPASRPRNGPRIGRVPSAEYLRVTPLTSNIKDQLSCLEEMITEHMHSETPDSTVVAEGASVVETPKKRELHDLFVQINSEINTIRTHCKSRLSKKGTDAVMNVLQKVRTHVTSIVNVMSLSKRKQSKSLEKGVESVSATYVLARPLSKESIEVVVMLKSSSLENSVTRKSSTVVSSSDDTWKYMTELNSLLERAPVLPKIEAERERDVVKEVKPAPAANAEDGTPIPPPRRRRTVSTGPEESDELPVRPPRKNKADVKRRDCSLESKRTSVQTDLQKKYATIGPTSTTTRESGSVSPPSKPKRSLAGDTFDLLRNFSCMRAQKDQVEDLERSLLEELSQMAVSKDDDEVLSEPDWVQTEVNQSLKRGAERAKLEESFEKRMNASTVSEISKVPLAESRTKGGESKHLNAQMASSQYGDEFLSDPEWVHTETTSTTNTGPRIEKEQPISEREQDQPSTYETLDESDRANGHDAKQTSTRENVPLQSEENISARFEGASLSAAFLLLSEATAALEIPLTNIILMSGNMCADDGVSSVQMTCEESDYATDTDTSALLKGTVQFFERYSPRGATPQSISSFSASQRSSKLLPELIETEEHACVDVQVEVVLNKRDDSVVEAAELRYPVKDAVAKDELIETGITQTSAADSNSTGKGSVSDETVHLVLEETLLSQMASSEWTDDTDRMTPLSRIGVRETDILSDDSVVTEIDRCDIEESFSFVRAEAKKGLVAVVFLEVRQAAAAKVADNTFDVEIRQEPESLALMIRVIEDQMNFTSLTVEFSEQSVNARACDDFDDASSFEDVDGESRTGITVSIIARSLHDGIYASLEEIPWGEVEMSLQECEIMAKSMEEDSKTSLQFNVVVSESTPEERKSLRSQASLNQSQNTISEVDNTLSTGSINIPSYVIKLGSTATITCELNNYLPPNSKIVWYKGTYEIVTSPGKIDRISHDLLEVLIINDVQMEDNELYSLKVNDDIFPVAYLIVEPSSVEEFAATILSPPQTQFVMEGQPTVLMCQVSDPGQGVVWLKDRKPLQESGRLQMENCRDGWHRVVFSHTRMSDQGTYFAFLGEQSVAITLVVEGEPFALC